jgi:exopolysaccharide biosynthesis polyprenyl glycosylphosphotransferase
LKVVERNGLAPKPATIPKWLVAVVDISMANLGLYLGFVVATGKIQSFQVGPLLVLFPAVSLVTVLLFNSLGLYASQRSTLTSTLRALVTGVIGLTFFSIIFAFWTRAFIFERSVFLAAPLFQLLLLLCWRILYWRLELWIHGQKKLLLIGRQGELDQALDKIMQLPHGLFRVEKVLEPENADQFPGLLGEVDAVLITASLEMDKKNAIIRESFARNIEVLVIPELYEIILSRATMTRVYDTPLIECHDMQLSFLQLFLKRLFDLSLVMIMAPLVLILILPAALAIRLTSPGPVIYAQERVGLQGRIFTLYKLRTMIADAEHESGPVLSSEEDDRVTGVGRFLRLTRIDELPQLYNVLRGELSVVGPRPERPYFVDKFQKEMPEYSLRHLVKPGITGLAQVAGYYATNTHDKLRYDLYYLAEYSLFLDFSILLQTVPTIFNSEAARGIRKEEMAREIRRV